MNAQVLTLKADIAAELNAIAELYAENEAAQRQVLADEVQQFADRFLKQHGRAGA